MDAPSFQVRLAALADVPVIEKIERQVWTPLQTEVYTREHFLGWLEIYPAGFMVVEDGGEIVGFTFAQLIDFDFSRIAAEMKTFNLVTDNGFSRATHRPNGSHHFGVTLCSIRKGAGRVVLQALINYIFTTGKPLLGVSRIPGFDVYLKTATKAEGIESITQETKDAIALHYIYECATKTNGRISTIFTPPPQSDLPAATPDPTLAMYLKHPRCLMYALLPNFLKDPQSQDYNVLFGYE